MHKGKLTNINPPRITTEPRFRVNVKTWGIHSLCINFRQSEQEENSVLYSSELCAELLYFCIERFGSSVCWTSIKEVDYFPVMHLYGTCHSSESKKPWFFHLVIPAGKTRQCRILVPALVVYQSEPHGEVVCFLNIGILPEQDAGAYALWFRPQGFLLI